MEAKSQADAATKVLWLLTQKKPNERAPKLVKLVQEMREEELKK